MHRYQKLLLLCFLLMLPALFLFSGCCQHDYQEEITSPTCMEDGYIQYTCSSCGDRYQGETLTAKGHRWDVTATCKTRTCQDCKTVMRAETEHAYQAIEEVDATCQCGGYTIYACSACGDRREGDETSIGDHTFEPNDICRTRSCIYCSLIMTPSHDVVLVEEKQVATLLSPGVGLYRCTLCNTEWNRSIPALSPTELGVPVIYITGSLNTVTKDKETAFQASYFSEDISFDCTATLKIQGASSAGYVKKNYTIRFYTDKTMTKKLKFDPFGWGNESKYCLKANYVDFSQSRNVVCGRLYGDIVRNRILEANNDSPLALAPNGGAIDGRPVLVYVNGNFHGFYTMNIPKDEWMFGMDNDDVHLKQAMLFGEAWGDSPAFRAPVPKDFTSGAWELEYCSTSDTTWVVDSFNQFMNFVNNNDGEAFRKGIGQYVDVDAAIDQMMFTYFICAKDNTYKNILWATYDGKVWIPSMYDMDGVCGMFWDGKTYNSVKDMMPYWRSDGKVIFGGNNFWIKLCTNYTDEIVARYWELRSGPMSTEAIVNRFDAFFASVPTALYECEKKTWPSVPGNNLDHRNQIITYMTERMALFDEIFSAAP